MQRGPAAYRRKPYANRRTLADDGKLQLMATMATQIEVIAGYSTHDEAGLIAADEIRQILRDELLSVRAPEDNEPYAPAYGGPAHAETVMVTLAWLEAHMPLAVGGAGAGFYLQGLLKRAGEDTWEALKRGVEALRRRHQTVGTPRSVVFVFRVKGGKRRYVLFQLPMNEDPQVRVRALEAAGIVVGQLDQYAVWMEWNGERQCWELPQPQP